MFSVFTARKRSLGQGNIFISVCHSVHRGEYLTRYTPSGTRHTPGTRYTPSAPGTHHPPPDQAGTPSEPGRYTPQDQAGTPPTPPTPPQKQIPAYGKRVGGTHPTGMHSFSLIIFLNLENRHTYTT